ncbi:hypothetical protein GCM10010260_31020 [Streptomyces filipinensis]|uniref:Uncharacterized protein n=1 Tax=Streptomyces filipinensis TaxID=66887 RepID=A0A918IAJ6_9ACTN|nr:hypothetical protein GCM10010260_31020 [Streptomyces filipinensis]
MFEDPFDGLPDQFVERFTSTVMQREADTKRHLAHPASFYHSQSPHTAGGTRVDGPEPIARPRSRLSMRLNDRGTCNGRVRPWCAVTHRRHGAETVPRVTAPH